MTDMKLNSVLPDVKGQGCPIWCVSVHDDTEDLRLCWSEDKTIDLHDDDEILTSLDEPASFHAYLEQRSSESSGIMLHPDASVPLTVEQARQLINHIEHLISVAESE